MKGQIISVDALVAITMFTILVALVLYFGSTIDYRASNIEDLRYQKNKLIEISDQLITTPGDPVFWQVNNTDVKSFGLAYDDHKLSSAKLLGFQNNSDNDYNNFRRLLNIGVYNTYAEFLTLDEASNCTITSGATVFNLTAGRFPGGISSVSITRIVKTDDSRFCKLRLWVWK